MIQTQRSGACAKPGSITWSNKPGFDNVVLFVANRILYQIDSCTDGANFAGFAGKEALASGIVLIVCRAT
jgi:hypothetical protein